MINLKFTDLINFLSFHKISFDAVGLQATNIHNTIISDRKVSRSLSNFESNSLCKLIFLVSEGEDHIVTSQSHIYLVLPIENLRRKVLRIATDSVCDDQLKSVFFITKHSNGVVEFTWEKQSFVIFSMTNSSRPTSWHFDWFIFLSPYWFQIQRVIIDHVCTQVSNEQNVSAWWKNTAMRMGTALSLGIYWASFVGHKASHLCWFIVSYCKHGHWPTVIVANSKIWAILIHWDMTWTISQSTGPGKNLKFFI